MNIASALIYKVLEEKDFDTWANVRKHYLPNEYHTIFDVIDKHTSTFFKLPALEELKLEVRDASTLDKIYALENNEIDIEPSVLLEYLKNEYAQKEALYQLDKWVESSIAFETAEEVVRHIQLIGTELETKVELVPASETMQKINLFDTEEEMEARITLGFNSDFDSRFTFKSTDYIMMGGRRGAGKSITGSNIARHVIDTQKKKALYFSVEMQAREVLQRDASISTGIPHFKIRDRNLSVSEWEKLAAWWASRYIDGEECFEQYLKHRSFDKFHSVVSKSILVPDHLDIVYAPDLTLGRMNAEIDKRLMRGEEIGIVVADYVQVVKRIANTNHSISHIDWQEQIAVSRGFKDMSQTRGIPFYSPYQIDQDGEARFSKGILDSCDGAFTLTAHKGDNPCIEFATTKMRSADDTEVFTSEVNWSTLKIGPKSAVPPAPKDKKSSRKGFSSEEISIKTKEIYDN